MTPGAVIAVGAYGAVIGWLLHSIVTIRREGQRAEDRLMDHVLMLADEEWAEEDETDAAFCRTLEEIQALPIQSPWEVA
jgi:hypothetical protein